MQLPYLTGRVVDRAPPSSADAAARHALLALSWLALGASLVGGVYWVLARVFDAPSGTTTIAPVHATLALAAIAVLLVLGCVYWPSIAPSVGADLAWAAAVIVATSILAFGFTRLGSPSQLDRALILLLPFLVVVAAVTRVTWFRRPHAGRNPALTALHASTIQPEEHGTLAAVMGSIARHAVRDTGAAACRLYTVSSDGGALVLRGEASLQTLVRVDRAAGTRRERLPVQSLSWLDRLLRREDWLDVPAAVVATGGMGDELTRTLSIDGERGDISMRHLRTSDGPVGVICVLHPPGESATVRARRLATIDREIAAARARIERALHLRATGVNGLGWWHAFRDLPYGVAVVNRGARVVAVNHEAERTLSTNTASLMGQRLCPGDAACACPLHVALRMGEPAQAPLRSIWQLPTAPLSLGNQSVNIWPITDLEGKPQFAVIALAAQAGATAAPLLGTEVASMISHELRAPLATLRMSSELALDEDTDPEDQRRLLTTISRQVDRLDDLVQDLADIFRMQAGKLQLRREPVDVARLCRALVEELREGGSLHEFVVDAADIGATIDADRLKVRTVLSNLVGNAVKFAPEGSTIRIAVESDEQGLRIAVEDRGPGIPTEDLPHVFEQFYRASRTASTTKGYGLGLYITRSLVELHGGQIALENRPEAGCRATFTLPRPAGEPSISLRPAV